MHYHIEDLTVLRQVLVEELNRLIDDARDETAVNAPIAQIQPTLLVVNQAAEAAAAVILSFEIGYRMAQEP